MDFDKLSSGCIELERFVEIGDFFGIGIAECVKELFAIVGQIAMQRYLMRALFIVDFIGGDFFKPFHEIAFL